MPQPTELSVILERIANGEHTDDDLQTLRDLLNQGDRPPSLLQVGKYAVNIQQALGKSISAISDAICLERLLATVV